MNLIDLKERIATSKDYSPEERTFLLDAVNNTTEARMADAVLHNPGNYLGRIDHLWAVLSVDSGGEGLCAAPIGGDNTLTLPMIAADRRRLEQLTPLARLMAKRFNSVLRLAKFGSREDIEVFRP